MLTRRVVARWVVWAGVMGLGALGPVACAGSGIHVPTRIGTGATHLDLDTQNLAAERDIEELLKGEIGSGLIDDVMRVAVPPFEVLGGDPSSSWMGEAVSQLVADNLARVDGVSVLERSSLSKIIEVRKASGEDVGSTSSAGKFVGASYLVLGKLIPDGSRGYQASVYTARVSDAHRFSGVQFSVSPNDLERASQAGVAAVLQDLGRKSTAPQVKPLSAQQLEQASRARQLQYEGKIGEAYGLFSEALGDESGAVSFETDYVRLLNQVGLGTYAKERAKRVLAHLPRTAETACLRARLEIARADADSSDVKQARQGVRVAASCGDPVVQAEALRGYSLSMENVHFPTARQAMQKSLALLRGSGGESEYVRCGVDLLRIVYLERDLNEASDPTEAYTTVARRCQLAGNSRLASVAWSNASLSARTRKRAVELRKMAVDAASLLGASSKLAEQSVEYANLLRDQGQTAKADAVLLEQMSQHLKALVALQRGLVGPEAKLDGELLSRLGVSPKPGRALDKGPQGLLVEGQRRILSRLLSAWAARTSPDSKLQGEFYTKIANELSTVTESDDQKKLDADQKLAWVDGAWFTLDQASKLNEPPLHAQAVDLSSAFWKTWERFHAHRGQGDKPEARKKILDASLKIAGWLERPREVFYAQRLLAYQQFDEGKIAEAMATLEGAGKLIQRAPDEAYNLVQQRAELIASSDRPKALALRREQVKHAWIHSRQNWIWSLYKLGVDALSVDESLVLEMKSRLSEAAAELEGDEEWEDAAYALARRSALETESRHATGTQESFVFMQQRVKVLDHLGDATRSIQARLDAMSAYASWFNERYRGGARRELRADRLNNEQGAEISSRIEKLAESGRMRDAVRMVASSGDTFRGQKERNEKALGWLEGIKDSAELPWIQGSLYWNLASETDDKQTKNKYLQQALDSYRKGNLTSSVQAIYQTLIASSIDANDALKATDDCLRSAGQVKSDRAHCIDSLGEYAINQFIGYDASRREHFSKLFDEGKLLTETYDASAAPLARYEYRTSLAVLAALGDRVDEVKKIRDEVRTYFTVTAPSPYQWVSFLSRVATPLAPNHPDVATEMNLEFDKSRGASTYWMATAYLKYSRVAKEAGNKQAAKHFFETGRMYAESYPAWAIGYELDTADALIKAKKWHELAKVYEKALAMVQKQMPRYSLRIEELTVAKALVLMLEQRESEANKTVKGLIESLRVDPVGQGSARAPCFHARSLEVLAGMANARGACAEADELKNLATKAREKCTATTCVDTGYSTEWCDSPGSDSDQWRTKNACHKKFEGDLSFLPR